MSILCSMVGASFTVAAAAEVIRLKKGITAVGNAQVDTAQSKFGNSSALFDGTGDYLVVQSNPLPTSGSFTVEFWIRFSSLGTLRPIWSNRDTGGTNRGVLYVNASGGLTWWNASDNLNFGSNLSANTWYHIACVKDGSTRRLFVDGGGMVTDSGAYTAGDLFQIGRADYTSTAFTSEIAGHIDEFRVSNTARYTTTFTPSTTPFVNDDNTVLLIHADGTDASTFFEDDNGVRAQTSVIQGTAGASATQISTAQSKFGGSSLVFDGNYDWLSVTMPVAPGSGQFTFECWLRFDILPSSQTLDGGSYMMIYGNNAEPYLLVTNSQVSIGLGPNYKDYVIPTVSINTWYHLALTRNSSNEINVFWDGAKKTATGGAFTSTANFCNFGMIGRFTTNDGRGSFDGYMDEIRVSNTCRYTTDFVTPTAPFVNDANTLLLIHGDGTNASTVFRDDNGLIPFSTRTAKTFTVFNQAQIDTAQYKFGSSSYLGDGTGDYIVSSTANDLQFTGDFTVELWVRLASTGAIRVPIGNRNSGTGLGIWWVEIGTDQAGYSAWQNTAGTSYYPTYTGTISANTWTHLAVVRNGSTLTMYKDGVGGTAVTSVTGTFGSSGQGIYIGGIAASYNWNGHIDEVRISNIARYTANFTPSTGPFNSDSNTVLLMHMEGTDASTTFTDDVNGVRTQKGIVAIGNAQIDTAQSKFGGSSYLGDGTGDYLTVDNLSMANDFTFECWVRFNALPTSSNFMMLATGDGNRYIGLLNNAGTQRWESSVMTGSNQYVARYTPTITTGVWYHIALVKSGSTLTFYQDGTSVAGSTIAGSMTSTSTLFTSGTNILGAYTSANYSLNGWMDEMRISNSARYTANFTPATAPFQNDANTVLLLHFDGTDASTVFFDDNGRDTTPTA